MPKVKNPFKYAQYQRVKIVNSQKDEIRRFYREGFNEVRKEINRMPMKETESTIIKKMYLKSIQRDIESYLDNVDKRTIYLVRGNMDKMVDIVCSNNQMFMKNIGFTSVPEFMLNKKFKEDVVNRIATGKLYGGKWNLSSAVWGDNANKKNEMSKIIAKGLMKNKSIDAIAKDIERFVNPRSRKGDAWYNEYEVRRTVDYNSQRLARTMISHAYEESFVSLTYKNPFIDAYRWVTSGGDKVCPLCIERETQDLYGLGEGIYPKDKLPLDHPNGMCTFEVVVSMSDEEIGEAIADWYLGEGDEMMTRKLNDFVKSIK